MARVRAKERYRNSAGGVIPSVTTVLNELNKPAMIRWANRLGLEGIDVDKQVDEFADIGILTHYLIMCRLRDEVPDVSEFTPEQLDVAQRCFKKYLDWEEKNPVKCIMAEEPLVSERFQYGGTLDLYGLCRKRFLLGDFKTSATGIYQEMVYQVAAYWWLLIENNYRLDPDLDKVLILRLGRGPDDSAEERTITKYELKNSLEIFLRCLDVYNLKKGNSGSLCTSVNWRE